MQQDNTLGAPTEGLGQSVTFKVADSGGVSQLQPMRLAPSRADVRGGNIRNTGSQVALQDAREGGKILDVLAKLGGDMLKPRIEEAKKEAFMSGMKQVASGTAVKEIVDEQPWYSRMFGDTPVVEGARTYASFAQVQQEAATIEQSMPELRKQSPAEFQKFLAGRLSAANTGDPTTDTLIAQQFIKEMPGLMKAHTKEHIGWQQQQFAEKSRNAQIAAASRFSALASRYDPAASGQDMLTKSWDADSSFVNENDVLEAKVKFVQAFEPVPGVPADTHAKLTTAVVSDLLSQRNLRAYYTLAKAGALSETVIGPENSRKLREQADRAEARARAEMPQPLIDALSEIKAMPSLYDEKGIGESLKRSIARVNAEHMRFTGGEEPLIEGNTAAELRASLLRNQNNEERRVLAAYDTARNKLLDEATKREAKLQAVYGAVGIMSRGEPTVRLSSDVKEEAWEFLRANDRSKLVATRAALFHLGDTDKAGQGSIRSSAEAAIAANDPAAFEHLYQTEYLPMVEAAKGREHVAKAYFGQDDGGFSDTFSKYHNLRRFAKDANQLAAAYTVARQPKSRLNLSKDSEDSKAVGYLVDELDGFLGFGRQLSPTFAPALWEKIKGSVVDRPGKLKDNIAAALKMQQERGLEFSGRYFWVSDKANSFQQELERISHDKDAATAIKASNFGDVFNSAVDSLANKHGLDSGSLSMFFYRDRKGQQSIQVLGRDKEQRDTMLTLTPADVFAHVQAEKTKQPWYKGGGEIYYRVEPNAPSIYGR